MGFIAKRFEPDVLVLKTRLLHWFRFDHLKPEEGVALLIGVVPTWNDVLMASAADFHGDDALASFAMGIDLLNGDEICSYPKSTDPEISDYYDLTDDERSIYLDNARDRLSPFRIKHAQLMGYWLSGKHPDVTPPSYFVKWATKKGIPPDWLPVAKEMGLIAPDAAPVDEGTLTSDEREKLLKTIAEFEQEKDALLHDIDVAG